MKNYVTNLNKLINDEDKSLQDPKVISASQMLNVAIVKYTEIVDKKTK